MKHYVKPYTKIVNGKRVKVRGHDRGSNFGSGKKYPRFITSADLDKFYASFDKK